MSFKVIIKLWQSLPGKFFCLSTKDGDDKWKDHFFAPDEFGSIRQFLTDNEDKNIYFCPHGFNRRSRSKTEAVLPNLLWADLDFADPRTMSPKPTIAIESSPGRFVGLWKTDKTITEALNRRLSYHVEADKAGWDVSQALRVPGTKNYKYKSQPRVRVLWDDGKTWKIKRLEEMLPADTEEGHEGEDLDPREVWKLYEKKLPPWVRRELLTDKMTGRHDRSEMLWKLENACIEAGMSMDEAFCVLKRSIWNKFRGRRNEDEQLRRELSKIVHHQFKSPPSGNRLGKTDEEQSREEYDGDRRFNFRKLASIKREQLDFIWYPYLVRGEVTIVEGDPGLGKSYLTQMIAAHVSTGQELPSTRKMKGKPTKGKVVYFDMENAAGTVTKPRLEDNGFDGLKKLYIMDQFFTIDDDDAMEEIYEHLAEIKPVLCVFDTLNAYIGKADTHKASESTQAIQRFLDIARKFNCAVVVLRHLTKGSGSAMYRGQGSIAFSGTARVVMSVGVDPADTETRAVAITKINFAKAPPALTFRIEERPKEKSAFIFGEYTDLSAQEIMDAASQARAEGRVGNAMQDAMEFLEETLKGVKLDRDKLYRMGEKRSVDVKLLERAAERLGVKRKRTGKGSSKSEEWTIPDTDD